MTEGQCKVSMTAGMVEMHDSRGSIYRARFTDIETGAMNHAPAMELPSTFENNDELI